MIQGIQTGAANAITIHPTQTRSLTEMLALIQLAQKAHYGVIISHGLHETEETLIEDLAVGTGAGQIRIGAPARGERTCKYNRLLKIESLLGSNASRVKELWNALAQRK